LPTVYSHSGLSSFEKCPKQWHYRYVLKIPAETETVEAFLGKRVHEVLERLHQFVDRGRVPRLQQVLQRFSENWEQQLDPARVRIVRSDTDYRSYRDTGLRCLALYYRRRYPFDAEETLGLEERVQFWLDDAGRYRMRGVIDRIARARDGALEIHDYKTGRRVPRQEELDVDRQLALYQLGVARRFADGAPVRLVWHYLATGQTRVSSRTREQLEALRHETMRQIDRIEAETEFEPRPSPLCGWCEYRSLCPAQGGTDAGRTAPSPALGERETRAAAAPSAPGGPSQQSLLPS